VMAEREIAANTEIFHSYGESLTADQWIQTFGFVPEETSTSIQDDDDREQNWTPVMLTKQAVVHACHTVANSSYPTQVKEEMINCAGENVESPAWELPTDSRDRETDHIPDNLLVSTADESVLSDDLVTLCCIQFLPASAYEEIAGSKVDASVLEDYYLGKLVCQSLLQVVRDRQSEYTSLDKSRYVDLLGIPCEGTDDSTLLTELIEYRNQHAMKEDDATSIRRSIYGLTVRLEEKLSLQELRKEVLVLLTILDETDETDVISDAADDSVVTKRRRVDANG